MSSKIDTKLIGTTLSTSATFKDATNTIIAPSTVHLKYKSPVTLTVTTTTVTPDVSNKYTTTVLLSEVGTWNFRWESIGSNSVADEFQILVTDTLVK